jgi:hypothetical protein
MRLLVDIAQDCRKIVQHAVKELGNDLQGFSVIDLCLDNLEDRISTQDIKCALVVAGVDSLLTSRLVRSYSYR